MEMKVSEKGTEFSFTEEKFVEESTSKEWSL